MAQYGELSRPINWLLKMSASQDVSPHSSVPVKGLPPCEEGCCSLCWLYVKLRAKFRCPYVRPVCGLTYRCVVYICLCNGRQMLRLVMSLHRVCFVHQE